MLWRRLLGKGKWWYGPYQRQITVQAWNVSGMIHTHPAGKDDYSISDGDAMFGGTYGGDFGLALKYSVYLVPTSSSVPVIMYRLKLDERDRTLYFPNIYEGQKYMRGERTRILLK